jgi:soluble lytic murein transglycosylase
MPVVKLSSFIAVLLAALALPMCPSAHAQSGVDVLLEAREALRKGDRVKLAAARGLLISDRHALAPWADYWELTNRLGEATQNEVEEFYARWSGSYLEDRLRNDWLLELGRRGDWANFRRDFPRFRMNDDREVSCYALLTEHLDGAKVRADAALAAWLAQREADNGCQQLGATLYGAGILKDRDLWEKARSAVELNRPRAAQAALALINPALESAVGALFAQPAKYLARKAGSETRAEAELAAMAIARIASGEPDNAASQLDDSWQRRLPPELGAWAWSQTARQAAIALLPQAAAWYGRAASIARELKTQAVWSDDTLAWQVRSALRSSPQRWALVQGGIDSMSASMREDPAWIYWQARAVQAQAETGEAGEAAREVARLALESIAGQMSFYGKLASEDLGLPIALPPRPLPPSTEERAAVRAHAGLARALLLIGIGLRPEGVREWNFSLRGMNDRQLLAAAQLACEREVWDRCINTSERTRAEVDIQQRFPTPFRNEVLAQAREIGLDPAYMYGLIRQESRFILDARSGAGAAGLMQVMPATARWTAKRLGLRYTNDMITDRDMNLKIGANYLKLVLDDFEGSQAMAAAAYNAGPNRPRRWREGPVLEAAIWAENIPFSETRDYVKRVLSNTAYYAALLGNRPVALKTRLGERIGPRDLNMVAADKNLP